MIVTPSAPSLPLTITDAPFVPSVPFTVTASFPSFPITFIPSSFIVVLALSPFAISIPFAGSLAAILSILFNLELTLTLTTPLSPISAVVFSPLVKLNPSLNLTSFEVPLFALYLIFWSPIFASVNIFVVLLSFVNVSSPLSIPIVPFTPSLPFSSIVSMFFRFFESPISNPSDLFDTLIFPLALLNVSLLLTPSPLILNFSPNFLVISFPSFPTNFNPLSVNEVVAFVISFVT